jgi:hypothetical protein
MVDRSASSETPHNFDTEFSTGFEPKLSIGGLVLADDRCATVSPQAKC